MVELSETPGAKNFRLFEWIIEIRMVYLQPFIHWNG
jgi:hypothetical protein